MRAGAAFPLVALAFVLGVLFLEMRRIEEDDARDFRCGARAVNRSLEPLPDQLGQQAAMVQVSVSQ